MIPSFKSGFSNDIKEMMEWRGTMGYSESCYSQNLVDFDRYCLEEFPHATVLTWDIAISFFNHMKERRDVRVDVVALRNLGKYQVRKGLDACVFPAGYFSYRKRRLPYIMSEGELRLFFEACDNYPYDAHNPLLTYTVAVIFRLQYSTGMRPTEVRLLKRSDFDFECGTIYISNSKRHKDRRLAVKNDVMEMCKKYDTIARSIYPHAEAFFPNRKGRCPAASSLQMMFGKCWKSTGIQSGELYTSPYILRHNFATRRITEWLEEGVDFEVFMPYLSSYMGHQTFRETCYYLHLIPERLTKLECMDISASMGRCLYDI